jgi:hypothetical protein
MDRETEFRRVQSDYKAAFGAWAAQVGLLQTMSQSALSDNRVIDEVRASVNAAEAIYRETRDQLAGMAGEPAIGCR